MFLEQKIISAEKDISYEAPTPLATAIRSRATFHEVIENLY